MSMGIGHARACNAKARASLQRRRTVAPPWESSHRFSRLELADTLTEHLAECERVHMQAVRAAQPSCRSTHACAVRHCQQQAYPPTTPSNAMIGGVEQETAHCAGACCFRGWRADDKVPRVVRPRRENGTAVRRIPTPGSRHAFAPSQGVEQGVPSRAGVLRCSSTSVSGHRGAHINRICSPGGAKAVKEVGRRLRKALTGAEEQQASHLRRKTKLLQVTVAAVMARK